VGWAGLACILILVSPTYAEDFSDEDCQECHADAELEAEDGRILFVHEDSLSVSVHEDVTCVECHTGIDELPHEEKLEKVVCAECHDDSQEDYSASVHGQALAAEDPDAPTCGDCHGTHVIRAVDDEASMVYHAALIETCGRCHADPKIAKRHPFSVKAPVDHYLKSAHYKALIDGGEEVAPDCLDCHGGHDILPARDPASPIHWQRVPETCGKCHEEIAETFVSSVHGVSAAAGNRQAPVCTDCHGEHEIRGPSDPESMVYSERLSKTTCVWCHESVRVTSKFDLKSNRLKTYQDSYHGLADRSGSTVVANCASCHGIHDIRASSDPRSMTHADRLGETCGNCHPGAENNAFIGKVHVDPTTSSGAFSDEIVFWVRRLYLILIISAVAVMFGHNAIDFVSKIRADRLPPGDDYVRFTRGERIQHATMASSFMVLAYSGFALEFPDAWWATPFGVNGAAETIRRLVHRVAAVAMVGVCFYHMGYLSLTRRGREQLVALLPRLQDIRDVVQMFRHYLTGAPHPRFDRFSYIEKVEYWALVWGSIVMSVTGFALWADNLALRFLPKWALDVATVIHYYEAILAVLAIVIWHFYWVIFNPRVYPMSLVWLTGRMSRSAMEVEHPVELDRIDEDTDGDRT
jgi:cytochrome b subunit of formate dehydrogenase